MSEGVKLILTEIRSLKAAVDARMEGVDRRLGRLEERMDAADKRLGASEARTEPAARP